MRVITDNKAGTSSSSLLVEDDAPGYTDLLQEREILIRRIAELEKLLEFAEGPKDKPWWT